MRSTCTDRGLREMIREQATRLFATRGFAGTSIREVVEACQCTKPALYYYFSSKEGLFREVVEHHTQTINGLIRGTVDAEGTVRERLHSGLEDMIEYCIFKPVVMQLLQRIEIAPEDTAPVVNVCIARETHMKTLAELMRIGIESGELRNDLRPLDGAMLVAGAVHFQFERSISSREWDRARIHRSIDHVLDGIAS